MTVWCFGSINADYVYSVPHLVAPGETLAATTLRKGLGGKGANQSVAAARAGAEVFHIGAVGPDGDWARDALQNFGVETSGIVSVQAPTAHAIIQVDSLGENAIVLLSGANLDLPRFTGGRPGDWLMLQNECGDMVETARIAKRRGLRIAYSAAPFEATAVRAIMPYIELLLVNSLENEALEKDIDTIAVERVVTKGAEGAEWLGVAKVPAFQVEQVVDTTGAGDCFAGFLIAGLDCGMSKESALRRAVTAAGLQVTKRGTADAMPFASMVDAALRS